MDDNELSIPDDHGVGPPAVAGEVFGAGLPRAERFATMLADQGVRRGLIGPREVERLWQRHLLNSAVLAELLPPNSGVVDVGSGAGLPGIPLAIARPDVRMVLLEPMARRVSWLNEVVSELALDVAVERGRAEEGSERERLAPQDQVVARAVAPMERLARWCLPLVRPGGALLALKGESAHEELARDEAAITAAGGGRREICSCGTGVLDVPATVVRVVRAEGRPRQGKDTAAARRRAGPARQGGSARSNRKER